MYVIGDVKGEKNDPPKKMKKIWPKFDENYKSTDLKSSANLEHKQCEENYINVHSNQIIQII